MSADALRDKLQGLLKREGFDDVFPEIVGDEGIGFRMQLHPM